MTCDYCGRIHTAAANRCLEQSRAGTQCAIRQRDQAFRERDDALRQLEATAIAHREAIHERDELRAVARRVAALRRSTCEDAHCGPDCQEWQSLVAQYPWLTGDVPATKWRLNGD